MTGTNVRPTNHDYAQAVNELRDELKGKEPPSAAIHERAVKIARKRSFKLIVNKG